MEQLLIKKRQSFTHSFKKKIKASRFLIMMVIPAIIFYAIFCYIPMYGVLLAFSEFRIDMGIYSSILHNWVGFDNFHEIFAMRGFWEAFRNTLFIGSLKIVISFLSAVLVALLVNELRMKVFKKTAQIIVTFPHFLSWVVVASLFVMIFDTGTGVFNHFLNNIGVSSVPFTTDSKIFLSMVFSVDVWKEAGWSAIIYIATMAGISPELYEAADIDGASRLQKIWHITLPGIKATAILLLIMSVGGVLSAGFDQIFNMTLKMTNYEVLDRVQIIDTLIFTATQATGDLLPGPATAIGLFKSVVGFVLVITTDRIAKLCGERGII